MLWLCRGPIIVSSFSYTAKQNKTKQESLWYLRKLRTHPNACAEWYQVGTVVLQFKISFQREHSLSAILQEPSVGGCLCSSPLS